ncbi:hypothetical protein [Photobacterium leiognathi]|uniref:hypothetical protein n=1 Tax=Photobacterium leiognathi TaxID=553611 RepID=UPI0029822FDE|nr:hypothetical protein [Photobacterium leiognathi]
MTDLVMNKYLSLYEMCDTPVHKMAVTALFQINKFIKVVDNNFMSLSVGQLNQQIQETMDHSVGTYIEKYGTDIFNSHDDSDSGVSVSTHCINITNLYNDIVSMPEFYAEMNAAGYLSGINDALKLGVSPVLVILAAVEHPMGEDIEYVIDGFWCEDNIITECLSTQFERYKSKDLALYLSNLAITHLMVMPNMPHTVSLALSVQQAGTYCIELFKESKADFMPLMDVPNGANDAIFVGFFALSDVLPLLESRVQKGRLSGIVLAQVEELCQKALKYKNPHIVIIAGNNAYLKNDAVDTLDFSNALLIEHDVFKFVEQACLEVIK